MIVPAEGARPAGFSSRRHVMFGSVAKRVAQLAHRPVLTIPARQNRPGPLPAALQPT
jgi:hypothetical protein